MQGIENFSINLLMLLSPSDRGLLFSGVLISFVIVIPFVVIREENPIKKGRPRIVPVVNHYRWFVETLTLIVSLYHMLNLHERYCSINAELCQVKSYKK